MSSNTAEILVCFLDEGLEIARPPRFGVTVTDTALACLEEAIEGDYNLVVVCVSSGGHIDRAIELCTCLKRNPLMRNTPTFVSIDRWHRDIAIRLKDAGLDFMGVRKANHHIDPGHVLDLVRKAATSVQVDRILDRLCPFLHYQRIKWQGELITCGAWHNRMVLGGQRLHEVCESNTHLHCEYFQDPRP